MGFVVVEVAPNLNSGTLVPDIEECVVPLVVAVDIDSVAVDNVVVDNVAVDSVAVDLVVVDNVAVALAVVSDVGLL